MLAAFALLTTAGCVMDATQSEDISQSSEALVPLAPVTGPIADPSGTISTVSTSGDTSETGPFFQSLGTNGRACSSCHQPDQGWTISPPHIQAVFNATQGLDPVFRTVDGSNSPNAPVATLAQRQAAYSMLLNRGLIRIGIGMPANAEFSLILVEDPYKFASANQLSMFRRPLPSTNLPFLSTVMWDGRENVFVDPNATPKVLDLQTALSNQSNDATLGHAQGAMALTTAQRQAIVTFETALFTAQASSQTAGSLSAGGATGGPGALPGQQFFIGINDPLGQNPTKAAFSNQVFTLFNAWAGLTGNAQNQARASIARGQNIFNTRQFVITGVRGLNGQASDPLGTSALNGGCVTCHDSPNVGNHSVSLPLDIGLTGPDIVNTDLYPRYTFRNNTTGETIRTSDPGRALISGKWADMSRFKGPILRGLASRAPYFHNGTSATLEDVVKFYDTRFHIGFNAQDAADLANFLRAL
jgi:cytochrome c peroxidase